MSRKLAWLVLLVAALPAAAASAATPAPGQLYSFGLNYSGELGTTVDAGTGNANPTPTLVPLAGASGAVTRVFAGSAQSFALTASGQVYAFGANSVGQLGIATNSGTNTPNATPAQMTLPGAAGAVVQVAGFGEHTLALTSAGQVYAFGLNYYGQLGVSTNSGTSNPNPTPAPVTLPGATGTPVEVANGFMHSLVLTSTGEVFAFGVNNYGQLGVSTNSGTMNANYTPMPVSLPGAVGPVTQIAAGDYHSLAITATGQLFAWGWNWSGQLASATNNGTNNPNPTPTLVSLPAATGPVVAVAGGFFSTLALTSTGQVYTFGSNYAGQLGVATNSGTTNPNPSPELVTLPGATGRAIAISSGESHCLVLTSTGQLYSFGSNEWGQLGVSANAGTANANPTPTLVGLPAGTTVDAMSAGSGAYSLVVIADLAVASGSLPPATIGRPYSAALQASGGATPYSWSANGLPPGLSIDPVSGVVSGTPSATGTFAATITVTDADGIHASRTVPVVVGLVPVISGLRIVPRTFVAAGRMVNGRCAPVTRKNRRRHPCERAVTLRIDYSLSAPSTVALTIEQELPGRLTKAGCVAPRRANRRQRHCQRRVGLPGSLLTSAIAGANVVTFGGRIGGHTLPPGSYTLIATLPGGHSARASFTITS